jgi:hypothetical protein
MRLETGHKLWVYHQGNPARSLSSRGEPGFHASVWYPSDTPAWRGDVQAYLGDVPEHVGPLLRRMFSRPDVLAHMRGQMAPAQRHDQDEAENAMRIDMTQR